MAGFQNGNGNSEILEMAILKSCNSEILQLPSA